MSPLIHPTDGVLLSLEDCLKLLLVDRTTDLRHVVLAAIEQVVNSICTFKRLETTLIYKQYL